MTPLPATKPEPSYKIKVNGNQILVKKQDDGKPPKIELTILEKIKIEGTDVVSFKFGKQDEQKKDGEKVQNIDKSVLECNAGLLFLVLVKFIMILKVLSGILQFHLLYLRIL